MNNLFEPLMLKFKEPNWERNPEFALIDTVLEEHPELIRMMKDDVCRGSAESNFGRQDTPSVEQIVRGAIYKQLRNIDYADFEGHQDDSKICETFLKLDRKIFSEKTWQKYIARISGDSLDKLMVSLNKIAIGLGYEDLKKIVEDSTVVETNIHYPTNNSLMWDCIKESHRLLSHLKEEIDTIDYRNYMVDAKKTYFKINNTKCEDKRVKLFKKQLVNFTKAINQLSNVVKKKLIFGAINVKTMALTMEIKDFLPIMQQVHSITVRHEINKEKVPNEEKIFSIYERHTDIIVKGKRDVQFGHKVDLVGGRSHLILGVAIAKGNPGDTTFYQDATDKIINDYGIVPESSVTDGGYASLKNQEHAKSVGIKNIVFNKIVGSLKNIASSKNMETRLKKWRSSIEAIISNLKRGFDLRRCMWKGRAHFDQKVYWSVIGYNIRVITAHFLKALTGGDGVAVAAVT
ncbi:transposase [Spirochaetia bacterium]|nr:transposase [Spirochaetia bacterium]